MDYKITYLNLRHPVPKSIQKNLVNLLENHYTIMGTHDLLVQQTTSCTVIYPNTGKIGAIIPKESAKKAKFNSADPTAVRFDLDGTAYVVQFKQMKSK